MKDNLLFITFLCLVLISCKEKTEDSGSQEARNLFQQSIMTLLDFNEKLCQAKDSAEVDSIFVLYDKRITAINFSFPSQTDFKLNEQENDSIFKLLDNLRNTRKNKLESFVRDEPDSISE